jgi:hypothetical protein
MNMLFPLRELHRTDPNLVPPLPCGSLKIFSLVSDKLLASTPVSHPISVPIQPVINQSGISVRGPGITPIASMMTSIDFA